LLEGLSTLRCAGAKGIEFKPPMDDSDYQAAATAYYLFDGMPDNVGDNWHRYICTDGQLCAEVDAGYTPKANEMVFSCNISGGAVAVSLVKNGRE
jgi:hypothetical protein